MSRSMSQWQVINKGSGPSQSFTDLLVITQIPEGCPPSDDENHPVVYNSNTNGTNPNDFLESPINPGQSGNVMRTTVGPFPAGSYSLTVTLGEGLYNKTTFDCKDIEDP